MKNINNKTLSELCKNKNIDDIEFFIETNETKPDRKSLLNACNIKYNYDIIEFLLEQGCNMDEKIIKKILDINISQKNTKLKNIITNYINCLQEEIKEEKEKNKILTNKIDDLNKKKDNKGISLKNNSKNNLQVFHFLEDDEIFYENSEEYIDDVDIKNKEEYNGSNYIETDDIFGDNIIKFINNSKKNKIIDIEDNVLDKMPKFRKVKRKIPNKYKIYFNKSNEEKMSFNDIKNEFTRIIIEEKWTSNKNDSLINLPEDIRFILGIEKNGYIRFDDIDKIICLFY